MAQSLLRPLLRSIVPAILIVLGQALACLFFVADALSDAGEPQSGGAGNALEIGVALALAAGIVLGAVYIVHLVREIRDRATAVAIAKGALSGIIAERFADWRLSAAESDVALFALKGCSVQAIADMRSTAPGTVRAQLSQVYTKAGVSSQTMLMSVFLEDLMGEVTLASGR